MTILIPELYCVYKTRSGFECVCTYKYKSWSYEMTIISKQWGRENNKFYLDESGIIEANARNSWIPGVYKRDDYSNLNNDFELVEKLTYTIGEKYDWDDY